MTMMGLAHQVGGRGRGSGPLASARRFRRLVSPWPMGKVSGTADREISSGEKRQSVTNTVGATGHRDGNRLVVCRAGFLKIQVGSVGRILALGGR